MQARQFVRPGEQLLILFTRGPLLSINWTDQTDSSHPYPVCRHDVSWKTFAETEQNPIRYLP